MKKILVVSHVYSHPTNVGNKRYIVDYCSALQSMGADVYFLYIGPHEEFSEKETRKYWGSNFFSIHQNKLCLLISKLRRFVSERIFKQSSLDYFTVFRLASKVRKIENLINNEIIIVNYYWLSKLLLSSLATTKAIMTHDCFTNKYERVGLPFFSMSPNDEQKYLRRSNLILSIQEEETSFFNYLAPSIKKLTIYPPVKFVHQDIVDNFNLIYLASNNKLNLDGIEWFLNDIYPSLRQRYTSLNLRIGGNIVKSLNRYVNMPGVELVGMVENIDDFYATGNIVINPTLNGTGLKIKTIEGISYGKIVITSEHSSKGLFDNKDIPTIIGKTVEDYLNIFDQIMKDSHIFIKTQERCNKYICDMNNYTHKSLSEILKI